MDKVNNKIFEINMNSYRGVFSFELLAFTNVLDTAQQIVIKQGGAMNAAQAQQSLYVYFQESAMFSDTLAHDKKAYLDSRLMY